MPPNWPHRANTCTHATGRKVLTSSISPLQKSAPPPKPDEGGILGFGPTVPVQWESNLPNSPSPGIDDCQELSPSATHSNLFEFLDICSMKDHFSISCPSILGPPTIVESEILENAASELLNETNQPTLHHTQPMESSTLSIVLSIHEPQAVEATLAINSLVLDQISPSHL